MKLVTACALVPLCIVMACGAPTARAHPQDAPQRVFACSLGRKSVPVTAAGPQLTYSFGTAARTELHIVASAKRGNVFYRSDIYASPEQQLRFVAGPYSYIVYSMDGDPRKDAKAISGLLVAKDGKRVADMPCSHTRSSALRLSTPPSGPAPGWHGRACPRGASRPTGRARALPAWSGNRGPASRTGRIAAR